MAGCGVQAPGLSKPRIFKKLSWTRVVWAITAGNMEVPTKKGITFRTEMLPQTLNALKAAQEEAVLVSRFGFDRFHRPT